MDLDGFTKVAQVSSLSPGEMVAVEVEGDSVLIANVSGEVYAVSESCTHNGVSLVEGSLTDGFVECPLHTSLFSLYDGKVEPGYPAAEDLRTYKVRVEGNDILVGPPNQ